MKRRKALSLLGSGGSAALAGCMKGAGRTNKNPASETSFSTATVAPENLQRRISLAQDTVPHQYRIGITAELVRPTITDTRTALVRITTSNEGPERALSVGETRCSLFNRSDNGSDEPAGLWLHRINSDKPQREDDKWVADKPDSDARGFHMYLCSPRSYEPGESVTTVYQVWDDYRTDGYLTPGRYRWKQEVEVWEDSDVNKKDEPITSFAWSFTLRVEER